jgi:hypothetical protein
VDPAWVDPAWVVPVIPVDAVPLAPSVVELVVLVVPDVPVEVAGVLLVTPGVADVLLVMPGVAVPTCDAPANVNGSLVAAPAVTHPLNVTA